ncbi:RpiR family transcriptional regulator [Steroidobacter agaridevorans]|uniref:RpiR family transcriptional regulator n=1 Tax=Steroidobacter agaridevorans TaxID=2695856 RepID=A0A829YED7_9GAMM|nr:MurR/RpiR family transcriptional regulator [Steroidobacter agaridevorans]GFE81238.1 RpiR family transcriptional regulator [Steroidobacter agaridevorans]GFE88878.1 RpiR family transcriptional regulator [Steroidobacter agaridevorans]
MRRKNSALKASTDTLGGDGRRPLLTYIKGILASLNPTDRLIADCVLADPERVITSSIAQLKDDCGASVGAIVAFCRRVGVAGFAEFKIALARDLAQSGLPAGQGQESGTLLEKVFQVHAQSLTETLQINPPAQFEKIAQVIDKSRRVELFSIGLSYPVAHTAYCKFLLLGLQASAHFDSHIQLIAATQLEKGDVAIGISLSGTTRETVECLKVAKAKGATTIGLTNAMKSPITTYSDYCLYATPSEIKYFQAPLASRVTQLALIDALFVFLALKHKSRTAAKLQSSGEELIKRRIE